jgi:hypothetical protein
MAAVKSAMNAMFTNRVGDYFLTVGFFAMFFTFGSLDYATIFSLAPYINNNVLTFIIILLLLGAAAKSAQIGLHIWLPQAMEGRVLYLFNSYFFNWYFMSKKLFSINHLHLLPNEKKKSLIWVYDIRDLSLLDKAPFSSKTECAIELHINRNTVRTYLDKDKILFNKWLFSSSSKSIHDLSKWSIPNNVWDVVTGELLGDGHIKCNPLKTPNINGRLEFTFSAKILSYVKYLKFNVLASICNKSNPTPWPNPVFTGKTPTQYWFSSKRLIQITQLHNIWYKEINGKYIKKLPLNIEELLTPIGLAHWIMGDGYFNSNSVTLCTDNFTKEEVLNIIKVLNNKFGIKARINKRTTANNIIVWRIRINKLSMDRLKTLVISFMLSEMLYKLGMK